MSILLLFQIEKGIGNPKKDKYNYDQKQYPSHYAMIANLNLHKAADTVIFQQLPCSQVKV